MGIIQDTAEAREIRRCLYLCPQGCVSFIPSATTSSEDETRRYPQTTSAAVFYLFQRSHERL
jgi:NAD-dependent dihydropyrimidine dehydrogenase PreA subunit